MQKVPAQSLLTPAGGGDGRTRARQMRWHGLPFLGSGLALISKKGGRVGTSKARFWTLQVPALQSPSRVTFKACPSVWDHTRARMAKTWPALPKTHRLGTITTGNTGRIGSCSLKISTEQDAWADGNARDIVQLYRCWQTHNPSP